MTASVAINPKGTKCLLQKDPFKISGIEKATKAE
jgi:hypothetical protein